MFLIIEVFCLGHDDERLSDDGISQFLYLLCDADSASAQACPQLVIERANANKLEEITVHAFAWHRRDSFSPLAIGPGETP